MDSETIFLGKKILDYFNTVITSGYIKASVQTCMLTLFMEFR